MKKTVLVTREEALAIAEETASAYSYADYTPAGWRNCCHQLALRGYDKEAIKTIMRSTWTRWATDRAGTHDDGTWNTLKAFLDQDKITPANWKKVMRTGRIQP